MPYVTNKGADQPALFSDFVSSCLDSVIPILAKYKLSGLQLASVAEQAGLTHSWSQTPEDRIPRDAAQI